METQTFDVGGGLKTTLSKNAARLIYNNNQHHTWRVDAAINEMALCLLFHEMAFTYTPTDGLTFTAPWLYVFHVVCSLIDENGVDAIVVRTDTPEPSTSGAKMDTDTEMSERVRAICLGGEPGVWEYLQGQQLARKQCATGLPQTND